MEMGADGAVVRRGRRPGPVLMRRFKVTLSLHPVVDAELIAALENARNRSALVREWLRSGARPRGQEREEELPDLEGLGVILG